MDDCYILADGKEHLNVNKFVVTRVRFKEKPPREIVVESVEYRGRIMLAMRATHFTGKPIVVEEHTPFELRCYQHTKTPNRNVNVKLLRERDSLRTNKVSFSSNVQVDKA